MDSFIYFVWRYTIGPALFLLLLLCGAVSFLFGGRRFFTGCWRMARYAVEGYRSCYSYFGLWELRCSSQQEPERPTWLSSILWKVLLGFWLQILFLILAAVSHFLLPRSKFIDDHMLSLANGVRNPAYVYVYVV